MKVRVSKKFADFINQTAKELGFKAEASVVTMVARAYCFNFGTQACWEADDYGDRDRSTGEYKAIRVDYPEEYHAMPQFLTTAALTKEFRSRGVKTVEELKLMVRQMCEI